MQLSGAKFHRATVEHQSDDNEQDPPRPDGRHPSYQSEPIPTTENSARDEVAKAPEQAESHEKPEEKAKTLSGPLQKALRQPRETSGGKVSEWSPKIEDSAAKVAQALVVCYKSGGREDARLAANDDEADTVPDDLMTRVGNHKCENRDGDHGGHIIASEGVSQRS